MVSKADITHEPIIMIDACKNKNMLANRDNVMHARQLDKINTVLCGPVKKPVAVNLSPSITNISFRSTDTNNVPLRKS